MQEKKTLKHNLVSLLPNSFTVSSIFCGLYALMLITTSGGTEVLYQASIAIFFAGFFDAFDGRIARLTKTQSEFGVQLDSLADMVSFGVAPSIIAYQWAFASMGHWGFVPSFIYTACVAIRLARFNLTAADETGGDPNFFEGLPCPLAASVIIALVTSHYILFDGDPVKSSILIFWLVIGLGALMVSSVPYWSFKKVSRESSEYYILIFILLIFLGLCFIFTPAAVLLFYLSSYLFLGLFRFCYKHITRLENNQSN